MARLANIDPLKLHNFRLGIDSITVKFDESKADKQAQRLAQKNVYAHPCDFRLCCFTGLGIHIALRTRSVEFARRKDRSTDDDDRDVELKCVC